MALKQWLIERSQQEGVTPNAIYKRIRAGKYPKLKLKSKNPRVVFVLNATMRISP
jgi:hypothetical protein